MVRGINNRGTSPMWLRERLRRAGLRAISPVVDVTNYVLLELGQPMHAYDLGLLKGGLDARLATGGEKITLLDGKEISLTTDVLVIADAEGAVGMAGVMGGAAHGVHAKPQSTCCSRPRSSRPPRSPAAGGVMAW